MVMVASLSAATGATGLERLLLIFLINFSESQECSKQHFSLDPISDQSEKTVRNSARKLKNTVSLQRKPQFRQKPPLPREQPNKRKNSNFHQTDYA